MKITHVIVVDDDPILRYSLKKMVSEFIDTSRFSSFASGYDALDHILNMNLTDTCKVLVLLDVHMPQLTGHQFLTRFEEKLAAKAHQFSIHILSSTNNVIEKKELLKHKLVESFIGKPITMEELENIIF